MDNKADITRIIQEHNKEIKSHGVKSIGIFGSFAKHMDRAQSDIDVLVEFRPGEKEFDNYMNLKFYLEKLFKRRVDLVIKSALKPRIRHNILREVVYARL